MSMNDLLKAFDLIEKNREKSDFEIETKSEELIYQAEKILGMKFPPTYRLFLINYGCGGISSFEIFGVIDGNFERPGELNSVWLNLEERKTANLPLNFIIVSKTGYGPSYVLDSSHKDKNGEYPVLLWMGGLPETPTEKVNEDFGEFLLEHVQRALEEDEEAE